MIKLASLLFLLAIALSAFPKDLEKHLPAWQAALATQDIQLVTYSLEKNCFSKIGKTKEKLYLGSIIKPIVSTIILQLEQENKLKITETLNSLNKRYGGLLTDLEQEKFGNIKLIQLMMMTSGIYDYWTDILYQESLSKNDNRFISDNDLLMLASQKNHYFMSGEGWHYSDTNYLFLQKVIERVTRRTLQQEIFLRFPEFDFTLVKMFGSVSLGMSSRGLNASLEDSSRWFASLFSGKYLKPKQQSKLQSTVSKLTGKKASSEYISYGFALDKVIDPKYGEFWFYPGKVPGHTSTLIWLPRNQTALGLYIKGDLPVTQVFDVVMPDVFESLL